MNDINELRRLWIAESMAPHDHTWRENLTAAASAMVARWDQWEADTNAYYAMVRGA